MNKNFRLDLLAWLASGGLCVFLLVFAVASIAWHKPAKANAFATQHTGYECTACHVDISKNVTKMGLTAFGTQWQNNKCPTRAGNLC